MSEVPEIEIIGSAITDRDGNPVTNETPEPPQFSRRALLLGMGATGAVMLTAGVVAGRSNAMDRALNWLKKKGSDNSSFPDCPNDASVAVDQFDQTHEIVLESSKDPLLDSVENGVKRDWKHLVVYPGILTLDPGVEVRTSPFADAESTPIDKPLYVQRPFLVRSTIATNQEAITIEDITALTEAEIPSGTLGFFAPDSNEIMYLDYNKEFVGIDRYSRAPNSVSQREVEESGAFGLSQERVEVKGRNLQGGMIYPYLYDYSGGTYWSVETQSYSCIEPSIDFIVLMRSAFVDDPAAAVKAFAAGKPPIDIPTQK